MSSVGMHVEHAEIEQGPCSGEVRVWGHPLSSEEGRCRLLPGIEPGNFSSRKFFVQNKKTCQ